MTTNTERFRARIEEMARRDAESMAAMHDILVRLRSIADEMGEIVSFDHRAVRRFQED